MLPPHSGNVYVLMTNTRKATSHSIGLFMRLKLGICKFARSGLIACVHVCVCLHVSVYIQE